MIGDQALLPRHLGSPLGRRLLAAFVIVAFSSVSVLTVAALVATDRGMASAHQIERQQVADRAAGATASAYTQAGGWVGADMSAAAAIAEAAGARLIVQDLDNTMVWPGGGMGPGAQGMHDTTTTGSVVQAPVQASGHRVGYVRLAFPGSAPAGRAVAWSWIIGAAVVALAAALIVSRYVVRRLARPLVALAAAAHQFAVGHADARVGETGPGELGEVARAFNAMADELVRAERVRRSLAADVAHELRTPLAALQAGLEEVRDGLRPASPQRLAELHDQTLRLGRVVQDLADLSAAESAAVSLHSTDTDLAAIARTALAAQQPVLAAVGLRVESHLDTAVMVRADPDRLHQAISNLLANAARYCRPGDRVSVRARRDADAAVVTIADTGPGIPADELPRIFDRLWRGERARTLAGSGIGLAVVRELVTAHGGTVSAGSEPGTGTTITIRLPVLADTDTNVRRPRQPGRRAGGRRPRPRLL